MAVNDSHTIALLHFDNNIVDEVGNDWTAHGSPTISNTQYKWVGGLYLPATGSYLTIPKTVISLSGYFTVDFWVYFMSTSNFAIFVDGDGIAHANQSWAIWASTPSIKLQASYGTFEAFSITTTNELASYLNTWTHLQVGKNEDGFYFFVNGVLIGTHPLTSLNAGGALWGLGGEPSNNGYFGTQAYIDELRISDICRNTESFALQDYPYPSAVTSINQSMSGGQ